ncbi:MAG: cytochrome C oxidase subunit II [Treponema sp.]|jgi:hypothetical protein|nr:cytochrome C oxidase subunit II [Treponema sp.]
MGTVNLPGKPKTIPPQEPAAADVQGLPGHEDLQGELRRILREEAASVTRYLNGKIPGGILGRLDIESYLRRHYEELFNRYVSSDDTNAALAATRHAAAGIAELLRGLGGAFQFNSGEIEKSQDDAGAARELEIYTNNILRRKTDIGEFLRADTAGSIVKCIFRDNALKPATVTDVKLAVNIPDSELIAPVFYRHVAVNYLIKDLIGKYVIENTGREISASSEHDLEERIIKFFEGNAIDFFNMANIRENIGKIAGLENIRSSGFTVAVNMLTAILNAARMDYQFIENGRNGRQLEIREYEDAGAADLPDERYRIRLRYFDSVQLADECKTYDAQYRNFENKLQHLWDLIEVVYRDSKSVFKVNDFEDLAKKNRGRIRDLVKKKTGEPLYEITGGPDIEKGRTRARLARMHERIKNMYEFLYPVERRIMEERLGWLEQEYSRLDFMVNPRLLQPGLLIDVDITSIKRRKATLDSMANVLNEFLRRAFRAFQEAAYALSFGAASAAGEFEKGADK